MKKSIISQQVQNLPPSGIRRFFDLVQKSKDVISLGVGEPDFVTPWRIREEAVSLLENGGQIAYTCNAGLLELREEIGKYLLSRYDLPYNPEDQMLVTVGASEAIDLAMRCLINPGDEVLIPEPSYVSYSPCVCLSGGTPVAVTTTAETEFRVTGENLEEMITSKTKVVILPYPNNPTGAILEQPDLEDIAQVLQRYPDIIVISDEIYSELTYGSKHKSIASLPGMIERTLVINGMSKAFAMTGWRIGYACGPSELISAMTKIHQYTILCTPTISQYAAIEALRNGMEAVEKMCLEYDNRRRLMVYRLRQVGLECFEPKGAFYVFPSIKSLNMSSEDFCDQLLREEGVAVVPGSAFGTSGQGHIRCSYAYSLESLEKALDRIGRFVRKAKQKTKQSACSI